MRRGKKALVLGASLALATGAAGVAGCSDEDAPEQAQGDLEQIEEDVREALESESTKEHLDRLREKSEQTREDIDEAMEDAQREIEDGSGTPSY